MSDCQHRPGPERLDGDAVYADCLGCGVLLWSLHHDHDGDGLWRWTSWKPAPRTVIAR